MSPIVPEVMSYLHNYFPVMQAPGAWRVSGSVLEGPVPLHAGCWIAIRRAGRWDGVYRADDSGRFPDLSDGEFSGSVWILNPPKEFLALCGEIERWILDHPRAPQAACEGASHGKVPGWEVEFAPRMRRWRKMFSEI